MTPERIEEIRTTACALEDLTNGVEQSAALKNAAKLLLECVESLEAAEAAEIISTYPSDFGMPKEKLQNVKKLITVLDGDKADRTAVFPVPFGSNLLHENGDYLIDMQPCAVMMNTTTHEVQRFDLTVLKQMCWDGTLLLVTGIERDEN